ncbi:MAG: HAD-IA family hydrolase [Luteolibacter sp.]
MSRLLTVARMSCGLIFDLDGTLVDSLPGIAHSLNLALAAHGLPTRTMVDVRRFVGNGSRVLMQRAVPVDSPEPLIDSVELAFKKDYDQTWPQGTIPYPGIREMLLRLQTDGYRLAVLSNKPHPFTTAIVHRLFPGISFGHVQGQEPGIPHKPDPTGALLTAGKLGVSPENCVFIGDSTIDLETARRSSMKTLAVTWGYHDEEHLVAERPDAIAHTPEEVLDGAPVSSPAS